MFTRLVITFLLLIIFIAKGMSDQPIPLELQGVGIDEKTGTFIDTDLIFTNEEGKKITLKDFLSKTQKPVVFALVYFECPNLCTLVLNAAIDSLKDIPLEAGKDFEVLAISFNSKESYQLANEKKSAYIKEYSKSRNSSYSGRGFHFWVGDDQNIKKLTNNLGFHYKWDKEIKQYAHASALYVLTPKGQVSRTFYGLIYPPRDLRLSLVEAGLGKIGGIADKFMLFCYHYDASAKKYVLVAQKIMTVGAAIFLAVLCIFMAIFWKKEYKFSKKRKAT